MIMAKKNSDEKQNKKSKSAKKKLLLVIVLALILLACIVAFLMINKPDAVPEKEPVSILLNGEQNVTVSFGSSYIDEHVTATRGEEDVSDMVVVTNDLDTSTLGTYTITYAYGGIRAVRSIEVVDLDPPKLELIGNKSIVINLGENFIDPLYNVSDNYDQNLFDKVSIKGQVLTDSIGEHELLYEVSDSYGNSVSTSRVVSVVRDSPLTQDLETFNLEGLFTNAILPETEKQGEEYIYTTAFIGDSVNSIFLYSRAVPAKQVWHVVSLTPKKALNSKVLNNGEKRKMLIEDMVQKYQPERIVLTMGVNNVGMITPEEMTEDYLNLVQAILKKSPDIKIIINNILPIKRYYDSPKRAWYEASNDEINKANYYIAKMCEDNGIYYLDSAKVLKDETGAANKELYDDGYHPSRKGMEILMDYILTHALID
jgi:lysophospholipase L1-like esterase